MNDIFVLFNNDISEDNLIAWFIDNIDPSEHKKMSGEFGFSEPNFFEYTKIANILKDRKLPTDEHHEYCWAINECGLERIELYSKPMHTFMVFVYLYCDKILGGLGEEKRYYYSLVHSVYESDDLIFSKKCLNFLEWLNNSIVVEDNFYTNYFLLLSWILIKIKIDGCDAEDDIFRSVISAIQKKNYTESDINLISGYGFPEPVDWLDFIGRYQEYKSFGLLFSVIAGTQ